MYWGWWDSGQVAVGQGIGQELVSPPHYKYDKAFLVAAHGSMNIGGSILARWKVLGLVYNRRETRDKRPLGRNQDRSWCHCHTIVSFLGCSPWIHGLSSSTLICSGRCPWSHGPRPKKLYTSVEVTSAPVWVPTQWLLIPSSASVVG